MKANIFDYATKELSQDAFLLWLIQWADSGYTDDMELHKTAVRFVELLISKGEGYKKAIQRIKVYKQWEKIDVSFTVNDELYVIVEDKTETRSHGTQLKDYQVKAQQWCADNNHSLICIYLKSGNESAYSLKKNVISENYKIVNRNEILDILSDSHTLNHVFRDYVEYLQNIENETNSCWSLPYEKWDWRAWQGFYMRLEEYLDNADWNYVPNANGGFMGIWWCFLKRSDCNLYLQIEQGNLCVKIGDVEHERSDIRDKWCKKLFDEVQKSGYGEIHKPSRFGTGRYMTIGVVDAVKYLGDGIIDINDVINVIKRYEDLINQCSE